jgi:hypothetical protein
MTPANTILYAQVKAKIFELYTKNSAYRSMAVIKEYKRQGGTFIEDGTIKPLSRWIQEKWKDVNPIKSKKKLYPLFRPTLRINSQTPTTVNEISKNQLLKQAKIKQIIKGTSNLKPFLRKQNVKTNLIKQISADFVN